MGKTKLQVALDLIDLNKAINIAQKVYEYIDIIEVGTPLLKSFGTEAIRKLSEFKNNDIEIFVDTKTIDAVYVEKEIAKENGGDYFSILSVSPEKTIKKAIEIKDIKKALDTIGNYNKIEILEKYSKHFDIIVVHTGIDEGFLNPEKIEFVKNYDNVALAGGINEDNIEKFLKLTPKIVIIGRAITISDNPKEKARLFREILESY